MRSMLLLALLAALAAAEGRAEANTVKLCGRDFVRAVVFTCGGSRWKRHLTDYLFEGDEPLPSPQDSEAHADPWTPAAQRLEPEGRELRPRRQSGAAGPGRRGAAALLTTSCCSMGCSEREISSLC